MIQSIKKFLKFRSAATVALVDSSVSAPQEVPHLDPQRFRNVRPLGVQIDSETAIYSGTYQAGWFNRTAIAFKQFAKKDEYDQEKAIHSTLNHPHILKLLGYVETNKMSSLVYVLATQGTLQDYLDNNSDADRTEQKSSQYGKDLSEGVYYLHSQNVLHGDIKPLNTLILKNGTLVINDFGCSQKIPDGQHSVPCNTYFGTEFYWPPEKANAQNTTSQDITLAYDIYTLGWVLYLLTTDYQTDPYANLSDDSVSKADRIRFHATNKLPKLPDTASRSLGLLIYSCMKKDPAERPTAHEVLETLKQNHIVFRPGVRISQ